MEPLLILALVVVALAYLIITIMLPIYVAMIHGKLCRVIKLLETVADKTNERQQVQPFEQEPVEVIPRMIEVERKHSDKLDMTRL